MSIWFAVILVVAGALLILLYAAFVVGRYFVSQTEAPKMFR